MSGSFWVVNRTALNKKINKNSLMYCDENIECLLLEWNIDIIRNFSPQ